MNQLKDNPYLKKIIHFKTITNLLFKNCDINGIYYYIYIKRKKNSEILVQYDWHTMHQY